MGNDEVEKCKTAVDAVAEAWASIDGVMNEYISDQSAHDYGSGTFAGYQHEAGELIKRMEKRGYTVTALRNPATPSSGGVDYAAALQKVEKRLSAEQESLDFMVEHQPELDMAIAARRKGIAWLTTLRHALTAAPERWLPIESAPKDGKWLMLYTPHSELPKVAFWWDRKNTWADSENELAGHLYTHWQPLPAPPAEGC